jgi:hypothetical protein
MAPPDHLGPFAGSRASSFLQAAEYGEEGWEFRIGRQRPRCPTRRFGMRKVRIIRRMCDVPKGEVSKAVALGILKLLPVL